MRDWGVARPRELATGKSLTPEGVSYRARQSEGTLEFPAGAKDSGGNGQRDPRTRKVCNPWRLARNTEVFARSKGLTNKGFRRISAVL